MNSTNGLFTEELRSCVVLNLGCGQYPIEGALNVDAMPSAKADIILDLNTSGELLTLPNGHYDKIIMSHVLEHVRDVFQVMKECHALLRPGGEMHICVPHFSRGFTHSEHEHGFDVGFSHYFNPKLPTFYYGTHLDLVSMRMQWSIRPDIYAMVIPGWQVTILRILNAIFTPLANLSPGFCSRIWCFWVGGFEQIEYVFRKPMDHSNHEGIVVSE